MLLQSQSLFFVMKMLMMNAEDAAIAAASTLSSTAAIPTQLEDCNNTGQVTGQLISKSSIKVSADSESANISECLQNAKCPRQVNVSPSSDHFGLSLSKSDKERSCKKNLGSTDHDIASCCIDPSIKDVSVPSQNQILSKLCFYN